MSLDPETILPPKEKQRFLLLARDRRSGLVIHHLMLLEQRAVVAERKTVLELLVPENGLEALEELQPRKQRVILA